ncbi:MAG: DUF559 domain-containing protein [Solirubrobacterales bacterium]
MRGQTRTREIERRISALATRQHGVVGRWQLLHLGLGRGGIDRRLRALRLIEIHGGVYAVGHRDLSALGRWMGAVLASGPAGGPGAGARGETPPVAVPPAPAAAPPPPVAVLSHRSAAALWGIRNPTSGPAHVTVPHRSRSTDRIRRHVALLPADETALCEGIPVTTVPRTLLDLAATASADELTFALREAEYRHLHDALTLPDLLARHPRRRGSRRVRLALDRLDEGPRGRPQSPLEELFVPFLRRHRLPLPELNADLSVAGHRHRVDCLWRPTRQIVELDGWQGHRTRTAFRSDRARDRRLTAAGYRVTRLTLSQLEDEPAAIAADLRTLLAR